MSNKNAIHREMKKKILVKYKSHGLASAQVDLMEYHIDTLAGHIYFNPKDLSAKRILRKKRSNIKKLKKLKERYQK